MRPSMRCNRISSARPAVHSRAPRYHHLCSGGCCFHGCPMTVTHASGGGPFHDRTYELGSLPLDPLAIQVVDSDFQPKDLSKYSRVEVAYLEDEGLPAGATTVYDAPRGIV